MESAGKARNNGLYRHIRTSKEIIRNLLNDYAKSSNESSRLNLSSREQFFIISIYRNKKMMLLPLRGSFNGARQFHRKLRIGDWL